jgi:hypothetical protein
MILIAVLGGSVAFGGAFNDRQVKGDDPDGKGYPGSARWVGRGTETQINKKNIFY